MLWKTFAIAARSALKKKPKQKGPNMSYQYGYLEYKSTENFRGYVGKLTAPFMCADIAMKAAEKFGENSPDMMIFAKRPEGSIPVGKAWRKKSKDGREFFSLTFDTPEMHSPVYCTGFQNDNNPDRVEIVWSRPRAGEGAAQKSNSAVAAEQQPDGIPFEG